MHSRGRSRALLHGSVRYKLALRAAQALHLRRRLAWVASVERSLEARENALHEAVCFGGVPAAHLAGNAPKELPVHTE